MTFLFRHAWAVLICAILFDVITTLSLSQIASNALLMLLAYALGLILGDLPMALILAIVMIVFWRIRTRAFSTRAAALGGAIGYLAAAVIVRPILLSHMSN